MISQKKHSDYKLQNLNKNVTSKAKHAEAEKKLTDLKIMLQKYQKKNTIFYQEYVSYR